MQPEPTGPSAGKEPILDSKKNGTAGIPNAPTVTNTSGSKNRQHSGRMEPSGLVKVARAVGCLGILGPICAYTFLIAAGLGVSSSGTRRLGMYGFGMNGADLAQFMLGIVGLYLVLGVVWMTGRPRSAPAVWAILFGVAALALATNHTSDIFDLDTTSLLLFFAAALLIGFALLFELTSMIAKRLTLAKLPNPTISEVSD